MKVRAGRGGAQVAFYRLILIRNVVELSIREKMNHSMSKFVV